MPSSTDVFMSSPPRPAAFDSHPISSSSPYIPSLEEVFTRSPKKPHRGGSQAVPIPDNARTAFTTAATILREAPEIDIDTEQITYSPPRRPRSNHGRKGKSASPGQSNAYPPQSPILLDSPSPKEKPWQKFKNTREEVEVAQLSNSKSRITKAKTEKKPKKRTETVSRHFLTREQGRRVGEDSSAQDNTPLESSANITNETHSEPALRRRNAWTPPRAGNHVFLGSDSDSRELLLSLEKGTVSKEVFQNLYDQYGRQGSDITAVAAEAGVNLEILKKRKRIDPISITKEADPPPKETSPCKAPAPKKKTRTITELATAPYAPPVLPEMEVAGPSTTDSLLNYFDSDGAVKALVEHQTSVMSMSKDKSKPKKAKAPAKTKSKKKPGTAKDPILLSPNSAMKQSSNQDFVFGTSSQLVLEESPTTLRDIQMAMQASNQILSDPFSDADGQALWRAGARDTDGELLDAEFVDLGETPKPRVSSSRPEDFVDIDDILTSPNVANQSTPPSTQPHIQEDSRFFQSQNTSTTTSQSSEAPTITTGAVESSKPNYDLFTDAQLARQITTYGFKPVKKRQAMIALLDQCWTSQNQSITSNNGRPLSISAPLNSRKKPPTAPVAPKQPPKPRGRPKKHSNHDTSAMTASAPPESNPKRGRGKSTSTATKAYTPPATMTDATSPKKTRGRPKKTIPITAEIADSDQETVSSSSRKSSPERVFSSPPPLDLSTTDEADLSLTMSPTDQQEHLFRLITKAVATAPRTKDPANPSWHEKMLLYDPIILEDFSAWLNSGELTRVGYDEEVSPFDVKKWCESKSVICLWRRNLNGKERKRY
ncbi:hypothetical protein F4778DRAFT_278036 [Xylariomycetidae sp. FL2044]|nr:hypothetical protein F4778DRAFT_278036 [Xylariomycetidae sp. FL2044]